MKIAFLTDTTCGYSIDTLKAEGVFCLPLQIVVDGVAKLEDIEITTQEVYAYLKEGKQLSTSLVSAQETHDLFTKLKEEEYTHVFAITISTTLSGTMNAIRLAAQEHVLEFVHVECYTTAFIQKHLIVKAKQMYEQNKSLKEIEKELHAIIKTSNTLVIPDDLKHLQRGGRLSPLAATLGGLLKIKPILQIGPRSEGRLDPMDKVRTMNKAVLRVLEELKEYIPNEGEGYKIHLAHVMNEDQMISMANIYKEVFPKAKFEMDFLNSVIGIHTGIGCIGIQYYKM